MEQEQFDVLTRQMSVRSAARRGLIRALGATLLAGTLGEAVARLGLAGVAAEKKRDRQRPKHRSQVHDEKRHRKKRRKKRQEPQGCGDGERRCEDGKCVGQGLCCSDERSCDDGSCLAEDQCCPDATPPTCGDCQAVVCEDGALICRSTCRGDSAFCCNGACLDPCPVGQERNPSSCQCACPSGSALLADGVTCCPYEQACDLNETGYATTCCGDGLMCVGGNLCT